MCPHSDDLDGAFFVEHLIDEAVLDVDASGVGASKIAYELLEGRRALTGIPPKD